jgi:hypothetical protein
MSDKPIHDETLAKLESLGAHRLAVIVLTSLLPAGSSGEWEAATIEWVLEVYEPVLKELGIPWIGNPYGPEHKFWADLSLELGGDEDYYDNVEEDEE